MKKKMSILLFMIGTMIPFMVCNNVYAEETTPSEEVINLEETQPETTNLTIDYLYSLLPDNMNLDIKESEAFEQICEETSEPNAGSCELRGNLLIAEKVDALLKENNIEFPIQITDGEKIIQISDIYGHIDYEDFHKVSYYFLGANTSDLSKAGKLVYNNTDKYNEQDALYVKNKISTTNLNSILPLELNGEYPDYDYSEEAMLKEVTAILNDSSLKVSFSGGSGMGDGNLSVVGCSLMIFKDDVYYETASFHYITLPQLTIPANVLDTEEAYINYAFPIIKAYLEDGHNNYEESGAITKFVKLNSIRDMILNSMEYDIGYTDFNDLYNVEFENSNWHFVIRLKKESATKVIDNVTIANTDVSVNGTAINKNDAIYNEMAEIIKAHGYTNIFGAYEFKVVRGSIDGQLAITFHVGEENSGKQAYVLHKKADGSYEDFTSMVENGIVTINVSELSPFMIALKDADTIRKVANPQTSSINTLFYGGVVLITLFGITYLGVHKNKEN